MTSVTKPWRQVPSSSSSSAAGPLGWDPSQEVAATEQGNLQDESQLTAPWKLRWPKQRTESTEQCEERR